MQISQVKLDYLIGKHVQDDYYVVGYGVEHDEYDYVVLYLMKRNGGGSVVTRALSNVVFVG